MSIRREDFGEYVFVEHLFYGASLSVSGGYELTGCAHRDDSYVYYLSKEGQTEFFWFRDIGVAEIDPDGRAAIEYMDELIGALADHMSELGSC
jgi:hypothetical protein